jgi:predicted nucleotidyltransferase
MTEEIKKEIARLEREHEIKILYAVESGSRAWGFASTDSDWDVRYIYIHNLDWYLKIDERKDSQEEILDNDIDLSGWELKKALRLFRKSNPPLLEWLDSPMVYSENHSTAEKLRGLKKLYFNPKSCLHHYYNMANNNFRTYLQREMVRTKKYLYVLRPILACEWILSEGTMAPMEFDKLVQTQVHDASVKKEIELLLVRKKRGEELSEEPRNSILFDFLQQKLQYFFDYLQTLEKGPQPETVLLDRLFRETLQEAWHDGEK